MHSFSSPGAAQAPSSDRRTSLLIASGKLLQSKSYSAFSYADLAEYVGIRKASIHYYFPGKADLGVALIEYQHAQMQLCLTRILQNHAHCEARLRAFVQLFTQHQQAGLLPLCSSLALEMPCLPLQMQTPLQAFMQMQMDWLIEVLTQGQQQQELSAQSQAEQLGLQILSLLEGSCVLARSLQQAPALHPDMVLGLIHFQSPT